MVAKLPARIFSAYQLPPVVVVNPKKPYITSGTVYGIKIPAIMPALILQ